MTGYPPRLQDVPRWARYNCLTYALWAWSRWGGYLLVRRSQIADMYALPSWHPMRLVPHFLAQPYGAERTHLGPTVEQRERDSAGHWLAFWWRLWAIPEARVIVGDYECTTNHGPGVQLLRSRA